MKQELVTVMKDVFFSVICALLWKTPFNWLSLSPPACGVSFYWKTTGIVIKYEWSNPPSVAVFRNNTITKANNSKYETTWRFSTRKMEQIENESSTNKTLQQTHCNEKVLSPLTRFSLLLLWDRSLEMQRYSTVLLFCNIFICPFTRHSCHCQTTSRQVIFVCLESSLVI